MPNQEWAAACREVFRLKFVSWLQGNRALRFRDPRESDLGALRAAFAQHWEKFKIELKPQERSDSTKMDRLLQIQRPKLLEDPLKTSRYERNHFVHGRPPQQREK
jgi:hypothetical protein